MYIAVAVPAIFFKPLILGIYKVLFVIFEYGRVISEMRGTGGQTELQAEGYTAVEDPVLPLLRELMQDRLTPEPTPSQWDRVIELLCDENFDIRRLPQVSQSLCEQSPYFERALQHLEEIICSGITDKELHSVDSTR